MWTPGPEDKLNVASAEVCLSLPESCRVETTFYYFGPLGLPENADNWSWQGDRGVEKAVPTALQTLRI